MPNSFDPGPPAVWEAVFARAPLNVYQGHPRFRTEFCPVFYRGRLDGTARVLVIGQDPATDEILAQRVLVGAAGQRVQGLLRKLGVSRSYTMFNTFLYGIRRQFDSTMRGLSVSGPIRNHRNAIFDQFVASNPVEAVIAFGNGAHHAFDNWPGGQNLTVFRLVHPTAREGIIANWNQNLAGMLAAINPDPGSAPDPTPYGANFRARDRADIPRSDLPFGIPDWHGTGGTHSTRGGSNTRIAWNVEGS
jgi:hypothetical protein